MSSFHKTLHTATNIVGTKVKNNSTILSTGIPSLDHIVGGGLPSGSIFAVESDVLGNYSRVMLKYFLAEGVLCKHGILVASADEDTTVITKELPLPCTSPPEDEVSRTKELDKMTIAWRYKGLSQVESSFGGNTNFGHHYDLSKHMDEDTIRNSNITHWDADVSNSIHSNNFKNCMYQDLLTTINSAVSKEEYRLTSDTSNTNRNVLRICIQDLGSPVWTAYEPNDLGQDLLKFMYCLRVLVRDTNAVAYISLPTHLFDDDTLVNRLLYSVDNSVRIESFAGSSRETNPVFKDYHGLFHVTKLSAINTLVPFIPPSLDLAFKLKRKKFVIEKLHLPPELQESSEREQDDITATPMACGGFRKKDIDF